MKNAKKSHNHIKVKILCILTAVALLITASCKHAVNGTSSSVKNVTQSTKLNNVLSLNSNNNSVIMESNGDISNISIPAGKSISLSQLQSEISKAQSVAAKAKTSSKSSSQKSISPNKSSLPIETAPKPNTAPTTPPKPNSSPKTVVNTEMRGIWISYTEMDYRGFSKTSFTNDINKKFQTIKALKLNTIFVQVRPFSDAFYASSIFPWSYCLSGTQGVSPGYDPLAIMVSTAHSMGLKIHAWVNPYRVVSSGVVLNLSKLSDNNPAKTWYNQKSNNVLVCPDGTGLYYNPASPEVNNLIVSGIKEIINKYAVDGVQFDDYFYPSTASSFDSVSYAAYQKSPSTFFTVNFGSNTFKNCLDGPSVNGLSLSQFRRTCVNIMIASVYSAVKAKSSNLVFGVSPAANISNDKNGLYVDVAKYSSTTGFVDYLMPQIYFGFQYPAPEFAFNTLLTKWVNMNTNSAIKLYIGLPAYKIDGTNEPSVGAKPEWVSATNRDVLKRMVLLVRSTNHASLGGFVFL